MNLYAGKILIADLTRGEIRAEDLHMDWARLYIGGKGLGFRYLIREANPAVDPLSPENVLIVMTGPLAGTAAPTSSRVAVVTKSPATGTIVDSYMGGSIAAEMKFAGFDGIIVRGRAESPCTLYVRDGRATIEDAREWWGKGSAETEVGLRKRLGDESLKVMAIGPAGEHRVPFACISHDFSRQAGRGGTGAVMGSKGLKAIAVRGTQPVGAGRDFLRAVLAAKPDILGKRNEWARTDGTPVIVDVTNSMGILPTRNFQEGSFAGASRINAAEVKRRKRAEQACTSCMLACRKVIRAGGLLLDAPEYETLGMAGANCGIDDLDTIAKFNELCDTMGLDTISAGSTIAFAMELTERGIRDFGLRFGDRGEYLRAVEEIARREGRGAELALGVRGLAARYGGDFAVEIKGLEFPAYDPRGNYGMGLAYATSDRGACHMRAFTVFHKKPFDLEAMVDEVIAGQNANAVKWCMILCDFWGSVSPEILANFLQTGLVGPWSPDEIRVAGERVWNLGRVFNVRAGFSAKDDRLPRRIMEDPAASGPIKGRVLSRADFERMRARYYERRGWDPNGAPSPAKLAALGVEA